MTLTETVRGLLLVGPGVLQRVGHPAMRSAQWRCDDGVRRQYRPETHLPAGFVTAIYTPGC
ncbi:hypothetical protein [Natrialba magadii]|uniref:hypothetical protein n=1 Tax=Natrialba magadii TaxID=13769 RepID=UPI0011D133F6|nr:hypothetical protein [Natrialba magadii]